MGVHLVEGQLKGRQECNLRAFEVNVDFRDILYIASLLEANGSSTKLVFVIYVDLEIPPVLAKRAVKLIILLTIFGYSAS